MAAKPFLHYAVRTLRSLLEDRVAATARCLTQEKKSFSTIDNHRNLFNRYIEPRWGAFDLVVFEQ
jgi:hypothetical protein